MPTSRPRRSTRMCWKRGCALPTTSSIRESKPGTNLSVVRLCSTRDSRILEERSMERTFWQKLEGTTEQVLAQLRRLVEEGNIRRVVVKQKGGTVAEFPLTAGVIGAVIAPIAAAIGVLSALVADCSIEVEKVEKTVTEPESTHVA